jgi:hypothetical protein
MCVARHRIPVNARVAPVGFWDRDRLGQVRMDSVPSAIAHTPDGGDQCPR